MVGDNCGFVEKTEFAVGLPEGEGRCIWDHRQVIDVQIADNAFKRKEFRKIPIRGVGVLDFHERFVPRQNEPRKDEL